MGNARRADNAGERAGSEQEFTTIGHSRARKHPVLTIAFLLFRLAAGDMTRLNRDHLVG